MYRGYAPVDMNRRKLPVMLQFHGGGWVSGRIARLCDVIVVAIGYRLASENRFPATFEDGMKVLNWLGKHFLIFFTLNLELLSNVKFMFDMGILEL